MKTLFAAFLTTFMATASAADWNEFASTVKVLDTQLKVSKITFDKRTFAKQFCDKLDMRLAMFSTLRKAATNAEPKLKAVSFRADTNAGLVTGIWGWSDGEVVKADDDHVTVLLDDDTEIIDSSLTRMNRWLIASGMTPYKGLPAICETR